VSSADADKRGDLFARLATWLAQDFPPEVTSTESIRSGSDRQKSSYGLPAPGIGHVNELRRKDSDSAKQLSVLPDAGLGAALPSGLQASSRECTCRPSTSLSACLGAQPTTHS